MEEEGDSKMAPNNFNQGNKLGRGGLLFCCSLLETACSVCVFNIFGWLPGNRLFLKSIEGYIDKHFQFSIF